jgi:archaellum component FlaD/FlaE
MVDVNRKKTAIDIRQMDEARTSQKNAQTNIIEHPVQNSKMNENVEDNHQESLKMNETIKSHP